MGYEKLLKGGSTVQQNKYAKILASGGDWWNVKPPIDFPQDGKLVPSMDKNNQQVGTNQVIELISDKIEELSDNTYEELQTTDGTHAAADKELKTDIKSAFTGDTYAFSGELADAIDDDDIEIAVAVELISIDSEISAPVVGASTTSSTGSTASNTTSNTSGTSVTGSIGETVKPNEVSSSSGLQIGYNNSTTNTSGGTATASQSTTVTPGAYNVTYKVRVVIRYDQDSFFFSFDTGSTYTYYTKEAKGVLYSPARLTVTK